jgi:hypothetical protein
MFHSEAGGSSSKDHKFSVKSEIRPGYCSIALREKDGDIRKPFVKSIVRPGDESMTLRENDLDKRTMVDIFPDYLISRVEIVKKSVVIAGGTCPGEVPVRESLGWICGKLSTKFNELRTRLEINLLRSMPTSFDGWIEEARFWDNNIVGYIGADTRTTAWSKGTFMTIGEAGGKNGTKLECRTHNTNQHSWNDEVYKGPRAPEPASGTNEGKNEPNKSKKGLSDGFKVSGDGKRSGKVS